MDAQTQKDFKKIVRDLYRCGYTQESLGAICDCSHAAIQYIGQGKTKNPKYSIGVKLVELWEREKPLLEQRRKPNVSVSEDG